MRREILQILQQITPEEEALRNGKADIEKGIYCSESVADKDIMPIDAQKLISDGKLIRIRTHTRFVHFPIHNHNYVEMVYMCQGSTHHVINGNDVILQEGELLLLSQSATQEIYPAKETDVAVNFIILPEFFSYGLTMLEKERNQLHSFVIDCLTGGKKNSGYLHFKVADILPIQNLVENLVCTILHKDPNRRSIQQITMSLLLLQLMNYSDRMETIDTDEREKLIIYVLHYIEEYYRNGTLEDLAGRIHYDAGWLSKEIKKLTGQRFTDLMKNKRMKQAAYLLSTTNMKVIEISMAVGYENISYFHKIFHQEFGMTPRKYRLENAR